jgi:hypothetical protein
MPAVAAVRQRRKAYLGQCCSSVLQVQSQKGQQAPGGVQQRFQATQCQKACSAKCHGNSMEDEVTGGVRERSRSGRASGKRAGSGGGDETENTEEGMSRGSIQSVMLWKVAEFEGGGAES